jgi:hypothetical protein
LNQESSKILSLPASFAAEIFAGLVFRIQGMTSKSFCCRQPRFNGLSPEIEGLMKVSTLLKLASEH